MLMKKKNILEYFEGTPDAVYDTEKGVTFHWNDRERKFEESRINSLDL